MRQVPLAGWCFNRFNQWMPKVGEPLIFVYGGWTSTTTSYFDVWIVSSHSFDCFELVVTTCRVPRSQANRQLLVWRSLHQESALKHSQDSRTWISRISIPISSVGFSKKNVSGGASSPTGDASARVPLPIGAKWLAQTCYWDRISMGSRSENLPLFSDFAIGWVGLSIPWEWTILLSSMIIYDNLWSSMIIYYP